MMIMIIIIIIIIIVIIIIIISPKIWKITESLVPMNIPTETKTMLSRIFIFGKLVYGHWSLRSRADNIFSQFELQNLSPGAITIDIFCLIYINIWPMLKYIIYHVTCPLVHQENIFSHTKSTPIQKLCAFHVMSFVIVSFIFCGSRCLCAILNYTLNTNIYFDSN